MSVPHGRAGRGGFDWDDRKAAANLQKHKVSFEEAQTVFGDRRALSKRDDLHSNGEDRFVTTGFSDRGRLLTVVIADEDPDIRIISARKATKFEARNYAQEAR